MWVSDWVLKSLNLFIIATLTIQLKPREYKSMIRNTPRFVIVADQILPDHSLTNTHNTSLRLVKTHRGVIASTRKQPRTGPRPRLFPSDLPGEVLGHLGSGYPHLHRSGIGAICKVGLEGMLHKQNYLGRFDDAICDPRGVKWASRVEGRCLGGFL
jgi:hypothetical protein